MNRSWSCPAPGPIGLAALRAEISSMANTPHAAMLGGPLRASSAAGGPASPSGIRPASPDHHGGHHAPELADPPPSQHAPRPETDITDLVRRAQEGDNEAFGRLYDSYLELVFRYVFYRVGSRAMAEDIVSETFLRALRGIRTFTWQGHDIGAWFITIARNLIIDHKKSRRARMEFPTDDILAAADTQLVSGPEESVLAGVTNRELIDAVQALNPEQRECVVLRFLEGLSVRETALAMSKNEGAIKALQYRAVRSLARYFAADTTP
ncbi:sigma-70 family RNA polymerase sigma factor [Frankia sp. CiP3]|uniref:sigma-70 family RNA polymerase sigma factor n=1 Tax=Frankia sp. CiP3 TaxID=2880971 RepID=UPI001EF57219|nr:sigma-70 family RNA polymerase sigma factor [Frankia sp. CiP3]